MRATNWIFGAITAALLFAVGFVVGSSPQPIGSTEKQSSKSTQQHSDYYYGYRALRDWFTKDAAGFFTALLFVLGSSQLVMFFIQLKLIRESLTPAEEAAKAALANAEHVKRVERAYVFIEPRLTHMGASRIQFHYGIKNYGKTPAIVKSIGVSTAILDAGPDNTIHASTETLSDQLVLAPDESWPLNRDRLKDCTWDKAQLDDLVQRRIHVWFYGTIVYEDVFGIERVTRFRWKIKDWVKQRFHADGGKPYNERT